MSVIFSPIRKEPVKSLESVLRSTNIAYHQGQRFCDQLAQGSQLAENLASKFSVGKVVCRVWRPLAAPKVLTSHKTPCLYNPKSDFLARYFVLVLAWCYWLEISGGTHLGLRWAPMEIFPFGANAVAGPALVVLTVIERWTSATTIRELKKTNEQGLLLPGPAGATQRGPG